MSFLGLTVNGVAVGLAFFIFVPSVNIVDEYSALYLAQLGYSETVIGLAPILGLFTQAVGLPLLSYLADRYRARKLLFFLTILITAPSVLIFLAFPIPKPICEGTAKSITQANNTIVSSWNITQYRYNNTSSVVKPSTYSDGLVSDDNEAVAGLAEIQMNEKLLSQRVDFFVIFLLARGVFELTKRFAVTLITVAAMTHLKEDKSKFGYYTCWGPIGGGIALFVCGLALNDIRHNVCGKMVPNYVIIFFFVTGYLLLTSLTVPFIHYEYDEHKVIDYKEVKSFLTKFHYIFMLVICCLSGWFRMFQLRWEFWYIEFLGGSPVVMAVSGLLKRSFISLFFLLSPSFFNYFSELALVAVGLLIFAATFLGLALTKNAWLIILFDFTQAAAFMMTYASFVLHFSNFGSKATAVFFQGKILEQKG